MSSGVKNQYFRESKIMSSGVKNQYFKDLKLWLFYVRSMVCSDKYLV